MEFASFLAGERWSDHPSCTHPLLGHLARQVNDIVSDGNRQQLVPLIPVVVGRRGDEHTWITLPVTVAAEPILDLPDETQKVLAAGLLSAERLCAEAGPGLDATRRQARAALDLIPGAVAWVEGLRIRPADHGAHLCRPLCPDHDPVHRRRHRDALTMPTAMPACGPCSRPPSPPARQRRGWSAYRRSRRCCSHRRESGLSRAASAR